MAATSWAGRRAVARGLAVVVPTRERAYLEVPKLVAGK